MAKKTAKARRDGPRTPDGSVAGISRKEFERDAAGIVKVDDPGYRRPPKESLNWIPTPY